MIRGTTDTTTRDSLVAHFRNTTKPNSSKTTIMFDAIRKGFKKARDLFAPLFAAKGESTPTQNEMRLDADEWLVKKKLGKAYFTKQLNPNTRNARIASLNQAETELAQARGWVR